MPYSKEVKFNFKARTVRNEAGEAIGKTKKQPSLVVAMPMLTAGEVASYLANEASKEAVLICEAVARLFIDGARQQFDEVIESFTDDNQEVTASMLDYSKLNLEYIASIPPTQRGATALTDEDWQVFFEDYLAVMVQATGKPEVKIKNHLELFKKPNKAKNNKEVLAVLIDQLDIYMAQSASLEDTGAAASRIRDKFDKWLNAEEAAIALDLL